MITMDALDISGRLYNTLLWFKRAVPKPTTKSFHTQLGCHCEEVAEMLSPTALDTSDNRTAQLLVEAHRAMSALATHLKTSDGVVAVEPQHRQEFLDALCDQLVTATGVGHMLGFKILEGLDEVNRSNWSKFDDGIPVFDENQKIKKGPNYFKADLSKFLS